MGVHLIVWIFAALVVSLNCLELSYSLRLYYTVLSYCDIVQDMPCSSSGFPSQDAANLDFREKGALTALSVMLLILHFTLFVMACIETDRRRAYEKKRKIIYLVAAPGTADGRMYYSPLDQLPQGDRWSIPAPQVSHHNQYGTSV